MDKVHPIYLTEHKNIWKEKYLQEELFIKTDLPNCSKFRFSHVGSTSINNICAKPIIDILVEIPHSFSLNEVKEDILKKGYKVFFKQENRYYFNKGYTKTGFAETVYHLHLRYYNDCKELYYRDYLNSHPEIAKKYEELKLDLAKKNRFSHEDYTLAKTEFVAKYTEIALNEYKDKYLLKE